ncbi:hypothetical protein Pla52o_14440 [Novipirellula galeiformis]|uniref:Uncharacterized protein n=1 Tax=Novipirellula galeiformis TaxID=2528004 RepID=A0A5C6CPZ6_9BACT|nr:hypothetical protein Pla52o_14440 [Novipirellula galeiformis]
MVLEFGPELFIVRSRVFLMKGTTQSREGRVNAVSEAHGTPNLRLAQTCEGGRHPVCRRSQVL